ncbi:MULTISPECIES: DUF2931 family protein [Marinobacter]|uniref:DUF2931 family protein n=1 Tax=Marinobacter TaxID=2742 RepID=UPI000C920934|nr:MULTISPECIES: DUF2931 family protein [Marinobacter]MAB50139.1 hypothetical protein [Marinobacter sp.]MBJ7278854.1 DUF2931 family protein [Marinobacter salarius]
MRNNTTARAAFSILLLFLVTACSSEPREYDFAVSVAGGPEGWPVWVEDITFDQSWSVPAGGIEHGFDQRPPQGGVAMISPKSAPSIVHARWFSYRTQMFHEVTFSLPDDLDEKLRQWYQDYPLDDYSHTLIVGFSGKGEALAWWEAFCSTCDYDRSHDFSTPLIENVQAEVADGDPSGYRLQTQELIDEGGMPSPW